LTEGTSIPAPLDSPPSSPRPATPGRGGPLSSHPTPKSPEFPPHVHEASPPPGKTSEESRAESRTVSRDERAVSRDESMADVQLHKTRTSDAVSSMSPASPETKKAGSVRKFLGMRTPSSSDSLSNKTDRPGSPATINSQAPSLSRRKSGSWFGKKRTFAVGSVPEGKVDATTYSNGRTVSQPVPRPAPAPAPAPAPTMAAQPPKPKGPPPPALPGLSSFGVNENMLSLGDDMFANIGKEEAYIGKQEASKPKSTRWGA
jgi:hypothetical protein